MRRPKKQTPENLVKAEVKMWLDAHGFFHFPLTAGLGSYPGLPDRIAVKNGVVLFIEIKAPNGKLSEAQAWFGECIHAEDCYYIVARGYEDIEAYISKRGIEV